MKRIVIIAIAFVIAAAAVALTGVRRVAEDEQAVRVGRDGTMKVYPAGTHFVLPLSGKFVTYPLGAVEIRVPESGTFEALSKDGLEMAVAFDLRVRLPEGSAPSIFAAFGEDFRAGVAGIVREAVEIETAKWSGGTGDEAPPAYSQAVMNDAISELNRAGVIVVAHRLATWESRGEAGPVDVSAAPLRTVIFVGVDGADWELIDGLIADGQLPNFARIVEEGATGPLRSIEPLLSPLVWTTMATGKLPEEHGILNFTVADPKTGKKVPISRLYRQVDAFWNMLGDYGRTVDIVGWLATYPAEPINGVMVTDRVGYLAYADAGEKAPERGSIYPSDRLDEISRLVVPSTSVTYDEFRRFIALDRTEFTSNRSMAYDPKNRVNNMIMLYASTQSFRNIAAHLLSSEQPDFLGVYYELVDATKHLFMHFAPPRQPEIATADYNRYRNAVTQAYVLQDEIIGEMMERCGDNTVLVIASDHGFKSGAARPKAGPEIWAGKAAFWHLPDGIICMWGNGVRRGHRIEGASILDVTPTLLALQGLPKPFDMPGKVLATALDDSLAGRLNTAKVVTLERERGIDPLALDTGDASTEAALKKLEALGYITPDNPDAHNNLGQRYQDAGEYEKAIEEFKKALAINPNFSAALNNVGVCYGRLKRYDAAEESFSKALSINPRDHYAMNNLAIMYLELRDFERAREYGEKAIATEPNYANGHLTLGSIYATMGRFDLAEREFVKTLDLDPSNRSAQRNLQRVRAERKTN